MNDRKNYHLKISSTKISAGIANVTCEKSLSLPRDARQTHSRSISPRLFLDRALSALIVSFSQQTAMGGIKT